MRKLLFAGVCLALAACAAESERPAEPVHFAQFVIANPPGAAKAALPSVEDRRAVRRMLLDAAGSHRFADLNADSNIQNRFAVLEEQDVDEPVVMVARGFPGRIVVDIGDSARASVQTSFPSLRDGVGRALADHFGGRVHESAASQTIPMTYQQMENGCVEPAPRFSVNRPLSWPYDRCIDIWGREK